MTRMSLANRSGERIWLFSRPKPRGLKSESVGSMPQRRAYSSVVAGHQHSLQNLWLCNCSPGVVLGR